MKRKGYLLFVFLFTLFLTESNITAQEALEITVQADKPGAEIQPSMWGVFFEDINFAADGGIYAELVKNRSFPASTPVKVAGRKINAEAEPLSVSVSIIDFKTI